MIAISDQGRKLRHQKNAAVERERHDRHAETVSIWQAIFNRLEVGKYSSAADLCPGDDPKIETALTKAGFRGKLALIDASEARLLELTKGLNGMGFDISSLPLRLESITSLEHGLIMANHPIDDLALSFYASKCGLEYDTLYERSRNDPEFSRKVWSRIVVDEEVRTRVILLFKAIAAMSPEDSFLILSQYPSKYERAHDMQAETEFCVGILREISESVSQNGFVLFDSTLRSALHDTKCEVSGPEHWLLARKTDGFRKIAIQLTERCNLRCSHCCAGGAGEGEMDLVTLRKILERLPAGSRLDLTGGEPMLFQELGALLKQLCASKKPFGLTTNGTVLREEMLGLEGVDAKVKVSVHGIGKDHDKVTGISGSFAKTIRTIRKLVERGVNTCVQANLDSERADDAPRLVDLCAELGVKELKILPLIEQGKVLDPRWRKGRGTRLDEEKFEEAIDCIRERAARIGWKGVVRETPWPATGHYVLVHPSGKISANPTDDPSGFRVIGHVDDSSFEWSGFKEVWLQYPFKESHAARYGYERGI